MIPIIITSKSRPFGLLVFAVNYQLIAFGLARVIAVVDDVRLDRSARVLPDPDDCVHDDDPDRYDRKRSSRNVVLQRQHAAGVLSNHQSHQRLLSVQPILGLVPHR